MCVGGSKEIYCDICIPQVEFKSPTIFIRYESNGCVKLYMEMRTVQPGTGSFTKVVFTQHYTRHNNHQGVH